MKITTDFLLLVTIFICFLFSPVNSFLSFVQRTRLNPRNKEKHHQLHALKPGVAEKVEKIRQDYAQLLEDYPNIVRDIEKELTESDFENNEENADFDLFNQIPDRVESNQPPLIKAQIMKSILDCHETLKEIEEDIKLCQDKRREKEERMRDIAEGFEKELLEIKLGIEDELNKLVE